MKKLKTAILILFLSFSINIIPDFNPSETPEANTNLAAIENAISASDPTLYFESATFDYYLGKKEDDTSRMRVKETYEAVFSDKSTSHGLTRDIPFLNQNGTNQIIDELNLKVTRNGKYEPIAKKEKVNDYYRVNIGSSSVTVQGPQTYVLEYEFNNVITEFDEQKVNISGEKLSNVAYQELYWNTNGTGWSNVFKKLTANVHFEDGIKYQEDFDTKTIDNVSTTASKMGLDTKPYCYTGSRFSKDRNCIITKTVDGFSFVTTKQLGKLENMSFVVVFAPNTFSVKEIKKNYIYIIITAALGVLCTLIIMLFIKSYNKKAKEKCAYAKSLFVAPQYQPPKDITVAEAGAIYPKAKKPTYVATLLELATQHKIQFISEKGESKILKKEITTWKVKVLSDEKLTSSQQAVLKILNDGVTAKAGDEIVVEKHTATSSLASTARSYTSSATTLLKNSGHLEQKTSVLSSLSGNSMATNIILWIIVLMCFLPLFTLPYIFAEEMLENAPGIVVGKAESGIIAAIIIGVTIIICSYFSSKTSRYKNLTYKGLDLINYLEGLRLYIDMAEEERLEFNQSVKNAPRTKEKIVKLYEKLLPYACIFGLEESWFNELDKYYKNLDYDPDWYSGSEMFSYYAFSRMVDTTSSAISSTTSYSSSSSGGGGFSSGGGGGGFSGGGGGGGGGGSW